MKNLSKILSLLVVYLFFFFSSYSQNSDIKRTYHWYFGNKAGLDFSNKSPTVINNSSMEAPEGCASISDTCGTLLFYTNGDTVWNRNNQIMVNGTGIMGCKSSTQGALIVPQPGNDSIYYLFTVDCLENNGANGLKYSIININMDNGLATVVQKNILLYAPASEKLAATYHANGTDIWILSCNRYPPGPPPDTTFDYYAYLLTASAINPTPVISSSSKRISAGSYTYMNFSHQGNKLANNWQVGFGSWGYYAGDSLEIFDFDKTTGKLSNLILLAQPDSEGVYGVVFSPDDSKLYVSIYNIFGQTQSDFYYKICQYDMISNDSATIAASKALIHLSDSTNLKGTGYFGMQTASDGRIYIASAISVPPWYPDSIDVIANPNAAGLECNYLVNEIYLGNGKSKQGLPNFISNYFLHLWQPTCSVGIEENIFSDEILLYPNPSSGYTTVKWLNKHTQNAEIKLFNIFGNTIQQFKTTNSEFIIQRNNLLAGIYFLKIQTQDKIITQKLIIH